jgi:lipopolysaccharide transport system permease protein
MAGPFWNYCRRVWHFRRFWTSLVMLDLRARYRRSILGVGWTLLHPVAMTTVLCLVVPQMLQLDIMAYAPFVLSGIAIWSFLTSSSLEGCHTFYSGEKYIRSQPMPLAIYPLRTVLGVSIHFLITMTLALAFTGFAHGISDPWILLALFPSFMVLFVFGWSMAVLFGFANVYFPDTHHIAQIAFQVLFYVTPIFYPPETIRAPWLRSFVEANPLGALVHLVRDPILNSRVPSGATLAVALGTVLCTTVLAVLTLRWQEKKLIFHL